MNMRTLKVAVPAVLIVLLLMAAGMTLIPDSFHQAWREMEPVAVQVRESQQVEPQQVFVQEMNPQQVQPQQENALNPQQQNPAGLVAAPTAVPDDVIQNAPDGTRYIASLVMPSITCPVCEATVRQVIEQHGRGVIAVQADMARTRVHVFSSTRDFPLNEVLQKIAEAGYYAESVSVAEL